MIMDELQRSMQTKLRWLNCKVSVVDTDTYNNKIFNRVRRGIEFSQARVISDCG